MDLSISHGQAQRLLKQRNLLAIGCAALFGVSVLLTLTAASREREVVLQPVLARPLTLSSSHIDKDYLELVKLALSQLSPAKLVERARAAGLHTRPLADTVRDTLSWAQSPEGQAARSPHAMSLQREAELLAAAASR